MRRASCDWRRVQRRRAIGIALIGADGAGKSTLAEAIVREAPFSAVSVYMGLHQGGSRPSTPLLGSRLPRLVLDRWLRWLGARLQQRQGRVVVFDRYAVDAFLSPDGLRTRRQRARRWLLGHSCPRPDVLVLIDVPGAVLARRIGGDQRAHERRRRQYLALGHRFPRMVVLDGEQHVNVLQQEVMALIAQASTR